MSRTSRTTAPTAIGMSPREISKNGIDTSGNRVRAASPITAATSKMKSSALSRRTPYSGWNSGVPFQRANAQISSATLSVKRIAWTSCKRCLRTQRFVSFYPLLTSGTLCVPGTRHVPSATAEDLRLALTCNVYSFSSCTFVPTFRAIL